MKSKRRAGLRTRELQVTKREGEREAEARCTVYGVGAIAAPSSDTAVWVPPSLHQEGWKKRGGGQPDPHPLPSSRDGRNELQAAYLHWLIF